MIIVDSSVWIDYLNDSNTHQTIVLAQLVAEDRVLMGDLILMEILRGFRPDGEFASVSKRLAVLECRTLAGPQIALKAAQNYRRMRAKGITVRKTIDIIIGTYCIENDLPLLHSDRDFDSMEEHLGLIVVRN